MNRITTEASAATYQAPARVNLIGEHTDYTGGLVLPMAIAFHTSARIEAAQDGLYSFSSDDFPSTRHMAPDDRSAGTGDWTDYPIGVLRELQRLDIVPPPFHLRMSGNVPLGAGLSSSASIEVATAMALLAFAGKTLPPERIALLCQSAENKYVGSPCGIMDQFVSTAATAEHALLLNTRDLTYELLPMNGGGLADCSIVVANSMVRHSIAGGDYGLRRRELEAGQAVLLQQYPKLRDLGDATLEQLGQCENLMPAESFRRCRHIISENGRVREAREAMLSGDADALGNAMHRSHISQRDDFECSVAEIDLLVDTAMSLKGCHGARLTGGGFGGCTVNLVETPKAESFAGDLKSAYLERFGIGAETYICKAVDGAVALAAQARHTQETAAQ